MPYSIEELYGDTAQIWHRKFGLFGSGRLIAKNLVLTARHVITCQREVVPIKPVNHGWQIRFPADRSKLLADKSDWTRAKVAWIGQGALDLALIEILPQAGIAPFNPKLSLRIARIDEVRHHIVRGLGFPRGAKVDDQRTLLAASGHLDDERGATLSFGIDPADLPKVPEDDWPGFSGAAVVLEESDDSKVVWIYGVVQQVPPRFVRRLDVARLAIAWSDERFKAVLSNAGVPPHPPSDPLVHLGSEYRSLYERDLKQHWKPRAMGSNEIYYAGCWYFTGRRAVLRKIVYWLAQSSSGGAARVITGVPGSGKSAILGYIVTVSDPAEISQPMLSEFLASMPQDARPDPGSVHIAVHLKGRTLSEVLDAIASYLGSKSDEVVAILAGRQQKTVLVFDSLEEADDRINIADKLLRPLTAYRHLWILIGSQRSELARLGASIEVLDLNYPEFEADTDVAAYLTEMLLARGESRQNPYKGHEIAASQISHAIAEKIGGNFLIAHVMARYLIERETVLDLDHEEIPNRAEEAFEQYLAGLSKRQHWEEQRLRRVLRPLAYAEGQGVPLELWRRFVGDDDREDITAVLKLASAFVAKYEEDGHPVYRFYHETLAEALRDSQTDIEENRRIVYILMASVPGGDWFKSDWYTRKYIAAHAGKAALLAELADDPLYLLAADPDRLLAAIEIYHEQVQFAIAHIYKGAFHLVKNIPVSEAASYLEMMARKAAAIEFADRVSRLPLNSQWHTQWANWSPLSDHRILGEQTSWTTKLAVGQRGGQMVLVSGGDDGNISVWNVDRGGILDAMLTEHKTGITALLITKDGERDLIVSGSRDGIVRVWDFKRAEALGSVASDYGGTSALIGLIAWKNRPGIVYGLKGGGLKACNLDGGQSTALAMRTPPVQAIALAESQGRQVLVLGCEDHQIHLWGLNHDEQLGGPLTGHTSPVMALAVARIEGRQVIVSAGGWDQSIRVWDLEQRQTVGILLKGHTSFVSSLAAMEYQGRTVIISGHYDRTIRLWDLAQETPFSAPLIGHTKEVNAVVAAKRHDGFMVISAAWDRTVRLWDLRQLDALDNSTSGEKNRLRLSGINALAEAQKHGRPVVITAGSDSSIRLWDLQRGNEANSGFAGHTGRVTALAILHRPGRTVVISGSSDESIRLWDFETHEQIRSPLRASGHSVCSLAVGERAGKAVIISGGDDGSLHIWDPETGSEVCAPLMSRDLVYVLPVSQQLPERGVATESGPNLWSHLLEEAHSRSDGRPDVINALTIAERTGRSVILSATTDHGICIWDLELWQEAQPPITAAGRVTAIAVVQDDRMIISGSHDGTVRIWDLESGEALGKPLLGHSQSVTALAFGEHKGKKTVFSVSRDNTLRIWDLSSSGLLRTIDVGAPAECILLSSASSIIVGTDMGMVCLLLD